MKIIAFGASSSTRSINKALATYTAKQMTDAQVEVLDINQFEVPMFSEDTEKEIGQAPGAKAFLDAIGSADALVIAFAEHNGYYPAAYKNLFDWASRIQRDVYQNKPAIYLAASPGPGGAQNVLKTATESASFFGGQVKGSLSVPHFYEVFDMESGQVTDEKLQQDLQALVMTLPR